MNKNINIFYCADDKFVPYLAASIASILINSNNDENISICILNDNITDKNKELLNSLSKIKNFKLEFTQVDSSIFEKYKKPDYINSNAMLYRYLIPKIKPEIDKALYLDCDTIIKKSLLELFNTNIEKYYIAGVEDFHWMMSFKRLKMNTSINEPYLNSGVLLINCKKWREYNLYDKLIDITNNLNPKVLEQLDQDAINLVSAGEKYILPPKYNLLSCYSDNNMFTSYKYTDLEIAINAPVIIHFSGPIKPWMQDAFPQDEFAYEFHKYIKLTPYYDKNFIKQVCWMSPEVKNSLEIIKSNTFIKIFVDFYSLFGQIKNLLHQIKKYKKRKTIFMEKTSL